jgi:biotin carboxyl carrier protein
VRYYVTLVATGPRDAGDGPGGPPLSHAVDLVDLPNGCVQASVDGRPVGVDMAIADGRLNVRVDGVVVDLAIEGELPELAVVTRGSRCAVRVESRKDPSPVRGTDSRHRGSDDRVRSPMPGRVVGVLVAEGQTVRAGQGVVVLEAMKMENEVVTRVGGVVGRVHVTTGMTVDANALLVTLA